MALDALLARLVSEGLVKAGGKQRTDSTHVVAAVAALNRLELAREAVRAALEALAAAHPAWLEQRICAADFARRYGTPMTSWRPPASQTRRDELAIACARDGYALLEAVYDRSAPGWLRELPAVDVLRWVLLQNYTRTITGGREVIRRREKEPEGDGLPPGHARIASPYDLDARRASSARSSGWATSCTSPRPATIPRPVRRLRTPWPPRPAPGGHAREHDQGCAQLVFPNLITHVATTDATVTDTQMTAAICGHLTEKSLAPGRHYLDSGYLSAALMVAALTTWGIALIGPLLAGTSAQARAGAGYARADFAAGYDAQTVTCPQGKTSASWTPCTQHGKDAIVATFSAARPRPLPGPRPVHRREAHGSSPCRPATWPKPRPPPARRGRRSRSRPATPAGPALRAPCTRPPATVRGAHATAACRKPASTTCTWPARSTCSACTPTGPARRWTGGEPATWHASNSASPHDAELTTRITTTRKTCRPSEEGISRD